MIDKDAKLAQFRAQAEKQLNAAGVTDIDTDLLDDLANRMKTVILNQDALLVSAKDPAELETVRKNFVVKKLGVESESKGMAAINKAAEAMSGQNFKNRAAFYYLVQKELS